MDRGRESETDEASAVGGSDIGRQNVMSETRATL